jgi:hypothetical protein
VHCLLPGLFLVIIVNCELINNVTSHSAYALQRII